MLHLTLYSNRVIRTLQLSSRANKRHGWSWQLNVPHGRVRAPQCAMGARLSLQRRLYWYILSCEWAVDAANIQSEMARVDGRGAA